MNEICFLQEDDKMKKTVCSLLSAALLLSSIFFSGTALAADEPVYLTLNSSEPISITENGTYRIDGTFTGDGTTPAITIADDVTEVDFSFYEATISNVSHIIESNASVHLDIGFSGNCSLISTDTAIDASNADLTIGAAGKSQISMSSTEGTGISCNTLDVKTGTFDIQGGVGNGITTKGNANFHDGFLTITGGTGGYAVDCNNGNGTVIFDDLTIRDDVKMISGKGMDAACRCETQVIKNTHHTVLVSDDGVTWYEV